MREGKHDRYKHVCTWLFVCLCTKGMCHVCQSGLPMGLFLCLLSFAPLFRSLGLLGRMVVIEVV